MLNGFMPVGPRDLAGLGAGTALGIASGELTRRLGPRLGVIGGAAGLVAAAAIYPAARRSLATTGLALELSAVAATIGLGIAATRLDSGSGRQLVAAGWVSHVLFDTLQGSSEDSRLPGWYPAFCVGYDVGYAARLATH